MLTLASAQQMYLTAGSTDLRQFIDSLSALFKERFGLNPFSSSLLDGLSLTQRHAHPNVHAETVI